MKGESRGEEDKVQEEGESETGAETSAKAPDEAPDETPDETGPSKGTKVPKVRSCKGGDKGGKRMEETLKNLPTSPGVYIMKSASSKVIYVGKAVNLKSRVRSYFLSSSDTRYAVKFLAEKTASIDTIVTRNEKEALILEDTLLKRYKPRYNIRLKDDKTYVSIKITLNEDFPRMSVTRVIKRDGARYLGPYSSAGKVRDTIKALRKIFPLCVCTKSQFNSMTRPCLDYQMGICAGPGAGKISKEDYGGLVKGAILFLEGCSGELVKSLRAKMAALSEKLDFEGAVEVRDQIAAIEETLVSQHVVTEGGGDSDCFAILSDEGVSCVEVLNIRDGRLVGSRSFFFEGVKISPDEALSSFIKQYYHGARFIPREVLTSIPIPDPEVIGEWLSEVQAQVAADEGTRAVRVRVHYPRRGGKVRSLELAVENCRESLRARVAAEDGISRVLNNIKRRLRLSKVPGTIEGYDISNLGSTGCVGAMVRFEGGKAVKESYRRFKMKTPGPNDYGMMEELLSRRFSGKVAGDVSDPDMILIDGGKGQLGIAVVVMEALGIGGIDVASLAKVKTLGKAKAAGDKGKKNYSEIGEKSVERVFRPGVKDPIVFKEGTAEDLLLRQIRDEVHRFAVTYHRKVRSKSLTSKLDTVKGVGKKKRTLLLDRFHDLNGVLGATAEELMEVPGITRVMAEEILDLKGKG